MGAIGDKGEIGLDLEAERKAFSEAEAGDEEVVIGAFVFDGASPVFGGFGDIGDGELNADIDAGGTERFGRLSDGIGEGKADLGGEEGKVVLLAGAKGLIAGGILKIAALVEKVEMDIIRKSISRTESPKEKEEGSAKGQSGSGETPQPGGRDSVHGETS